MSFFKKFIAWLRLDNVTLNDKEELRLWDMEIEINDLNNKLKSLSLSNDVKKAALIRLREWDMLDACDDGPWAKRLIDDALK